MSEPCEAPGFILKLALLLCRFAGFQYLFEPRCRLISECDQVSSEDEWRCFGRGILVWVIGSDGEYLLSELLDGGCQSGGQRRASAEICFNQADQLSDWCWVQSREQSVAGFVAEGGAGVHQVFGDQWQNRIDELWWCLNFLEELTGNGDSGGRMSGRFPASLFEDSGGRFAEVVAECGEQQFFLLLWAEAIALADDGGLVAHMQCVHPDITFRVPVRILWSFAECGEFGEQSELAGVQE